MDTKQQLHVFAHSGSIKAANKMRRHISNMPNVRHVGNVLNIRHVGNVPPQLDDTESRERLSRQAAQSLDTLKCAED